jgi:hypothetical protein
VVMVWVVFNTLESQSSSDCSESGIQSAVVAEYRPNRNCMDSMGI